MTEIICRAGDEPETKSAALLVLMATLENATHPKALANSAKHFAFTRCGELNLYGMVDAEIAVVEDQLLAAQLKLESITTITEPGAVATALAQHKRSNSTTEPLTVVSAHMTQLVAKSSSRSLSTYSAASNNGFELSDVSADYRMMV